MYGLSGCMGCMAAVWYCMVYGLYGLYGCMAIPKRETRRAGCMGRKSRFAEILISPPRSDEQVSMAFRTVALLSIYFRKYETKTKRTYGA